MDEWKINLVIIGAAKAGTTSLAKWLEDTPGVCWSRPKETMFFGADATYAKGFDWFRNTYYPHFAGEAVVGESTPAYADVTRTPLAAERIYAHNPDCKIIFMVREPIARTISAWRMWASFEPTKGPFSNHLIMHAKKGFMAWLQDPEIYQHVIESNRYAFQWTHWEAFSDRMVLFLDDLKRDKAGVLKQVAAFVDVNPDALLQASTIVYNDGAERDKKTPLYHMIRNNPLWRAIKSFVPAKLKETAVKSSIASTPLTFSDKDWDPAIYQRLCDDLRPDVQAFLAAHDKPADLWPAFAQPQS